MRAIGKNTTHHFGAIILNSSTSLSRGGIPSRYVVLFVPLLAFSWLLPNHQLPWTSFHSDAWMALILCLIAFWVFIRTPGNVLIPSLSLLFFATACIPWLQYLGGMIYSSGNAWMQSLYVAGFAVAILIGRQWHSDTPDQPLNFLFSAFLFGGLVSVFIEFLQILQYSSVWINTFMGGRASGNINQPNQLGTLLLLALLGVAWWHQKKYISSVVGLILSVILLTGLSLTLSRTSWVNLTLIGALLFIFPLASSEKKWRLAIGCMLGYFALVTFFTPEFISLLSDLPASQRVLSDPFRIAIWLGSIEAIADKPWLGWGWGETYSALMDSSYASSIRITKHSHNIVLDLLIYNGIPLGLCIVGLSIAALAHTIRLFKAPERRIPILAAAVFIVHAMLELPLHHAYFLMPFGILLGTLSTITPKIAIPKAATLLLPVALLSAVLATSKDYFQIERDFGEIGYVTNYATPFTPKPLLLLSQWEDRQWFANTKPAPIRDKEELRRIENVIFSAPQSIMEVKLAHHLILGNDPQRASLWLNHMCNSGEPRVVTALLEHWMSLSNSNPIFSTVVVPKCEEVMSKYKEEP